MCAIPYLLPLSLPLALILGAVTGIGQLNLYPLGMFMVVVPLLDAVLGRMERGSGGPGDRVLLWIPALYGVLHLGALIAVLWTVPGLDLNELAVATIALGLVGGIGIAAYHELIHKRGRVFKTAGRIGMTLVAYPHFEMSHLASHHRHACTPEDHSTAWRGESLYRFLARTIPSCFQCSMALERRRHPGAWLWSSVTGRGVIAVLIGCAALAVISPLMLVVFLGHAMISILQLETVSYIEHYGLMRAPDQPLGTLPRHLSWDSRHFVSNLLTFKLQHHAAHHESGSRPFIELDATAASPQLPSGYPLMISIAMCPPLWRRVIHPRFT